MKLLLVQNMVYVPSLGGANKSNRLLLEALSKRGHKCRVVAPSTGIQSGPTSHDQFLTELTDRSIRVLSSSRAMHRCEFKGVEVHAVSNARQLSDHVGTQIHEFDPTWVLVCNDVGGTLLPAAFKASPSRVVYLVHTTSELPFGPAAAFESPQIAALLRKAAGIVTPSRYLKDYIARWGKLEAINPPILFYGTGPFPNLASFDAGSVTMVNPCASKGIDIFLELARRMPNVAFAAIPTWGTTREDRIALEGLPNVSLLAPVDDIDEFLKRSRIVLVPSLWAEAFGRISIEAMLRGIPVLASNVGGLPEAKLGIDYLLPVRPIERYEDRFDEKANPVAIVPQQDIGPWFQALQRLLVDSNHYEQLSDASRVAATDFVSGLKVDEFEHFLETLRPDVQNDEQQQVLRDSEPVTSARGLATELTPGKRALLAARLRANRASKTLNGGIYRGYPDRHQCVFIHIPKTAGSSVATALFDCDSRHVRWTEYHLADPRKFSQYFKFAFVRHPWDRVMSAYTFLQQGGMHQQDRAWATRNLSRYESFEQFVHEWLNEKNVWSWVHFVPQYYWICDDAMECQMDFVGRVEKIEVDFRAIAQRVRPDATLPVNNRNRTDHYSWHYTDAMRDIVARVYADDIRLFDYRFERVESKT